MFQLIPSNKLVIGKKYWITFKCDDYSGIYEGPTTIHNRNHFIFGDIYDLIEKEHFQHPFYFTNQYVYYEFVSQQPQWKMERRAVNLIVRRLIGDDCFEW